MTLNSSSKGIPVCHWVVMYYSVSNNPHAASVLCLSTGIYHRLPAKSKSRLALAMHVEAQLGYFISLLVYAEFGSFACSSIWCGLLWFDFVWLLSCFWRMSALRTATRDHMPSLFVIVLYFLYWVWLAWLLAGLV